MLSKQREYSFPMLEVSVPEHRNLVDTTKKSS